ncbi:MAG: 16S rRNA (cytidine(1402)-2'-O)-methyltransferase [Armatimonadetes bacterium]|nr:16S rRNA (cytidine(1402)-2'-O)-methyltransferase [Armatimonadota bacterium]
MTTGTLYLVATPIGNLEDFTLRALRVLREVQLIAAEDTRHTARLLRHFQIATPAISYHAHNERARVAPLLARLRAGDNVALVTDAGTPGISDPGAAIVRACAEAGIAVVPIPGPSAALAALAASGLPTDQFTFIGFLPRKTGERRRRLQSLRDLPGTLLFFESPGRTRAALDAMLETLGDRDAVIAREITKRHEEFVRGSLSSLRARFASDDPRGEITLVVAGAALEENAERDGRGEDLDAVLRTLLDGGVAVRDAAADAATRCGVPRRVAYQRALSLRDQRQADATPSA